jgi:hypothetical protein
VFYPIDRAAAQTSRWLKEFLGVGFGYEIDKKLLFDAPAQNARFLEPANNCQYH